MRDSKSNVSPYPDTTQSDNELDSGTANTEKTEKKPQQTRKPKYKNVMLNSHDSKKKINSQHYLLAAQY